MPKPKNPPTERIARLFEKNLITLLRDGRPAFDASGEPVADVDGKQVYRPASAPELKVAADWLKAAGVTPNAAFDPYEAAINKIRASKNQLDATAIAGRLNVGGAS